MKHHGGQQVAGNNRSSLARGKWIEAIHARLELHFLQRLPSQEGSGLKHDCWYKPLKQAESSLARGKWIEAFLFVEQTRMRKGLPSQEGSGLKHVISKNRPPATGLPSQEGSGLKRSGFPWHLLRFFRSSLARGKWIEAIPRHPFINSSMSSLARGKWIEASCPCGVPPGMSGLPSQEGSGLKLPTMPCPQIRTSSSLARGKWIEAIGDRYPSLIAFVFPRKREVD